MAKVTLDNVRKVYDDGQEFVAVHGASLEVSDGELVVMVGPSGCGKTTILRMIAGLESITAGRLSIGGRVVNDVPAKARNIAMVFQNYALYPHMSVYDNLAFGLKLRKMSKPDIDARVREAADMLGLETILDRKPRQLSGGQRQRVALGRALVRHPQVFLFDEPLSNLDAKLRVHMRTEIARLHRRLDATMVYVTHDQVEAMTIGERIVVLNAGRVEQVDTPMGLYELPKNRFVAGFIGSPSMNFLDGRLTRADGPRFEALDAGIELTLGDARADELAGWFDREVTLGVRPEDLSVAGGEAADGLTTRLVLDVVEPMGNETFVYAGAGEDPLVARVEPRPLPEPGEPIALAFDPDRLHFFDPESGERIGG